MKCPYPILIKNSLGYVMRVPCGQCIACRLNKARAYSIRIMNETVYHKKSCFLSLTYDDEFLPVNHSLDKSALQKFLKRLRKRVGVPIRYFACGEYGEEKLRPHFHICLFGLGEDDEVFLNKIRRKTGRGNYVWQCKMKDWKFGNCYVGMLDYDSACYVARYTSKKLLANDSKIPDKQFWQDRGLLPPYLVMSNRPGIGAEYVRDNFNRLKKREYVLAKGGVKAPLPRYYRQKLGFNTFDSDFAYKKQQLETKDRAESVGKSWSAFEKDLIAGARNIVESFMENMKGK